MKKNTKRILLTNVLPPIIAAVLASILTLLGSYYLTDRPSLLKEYKAMGVSILSNEKISKDMELYARQLINQESPEKIKLTKNEKANRLNMLIKNVPADFPMINTDMTWGELSLKFLVVLDWIDEIKMTCPECINEDKFRREYKTKLQFKNEMEKLKSAE